MVSHRQWTTEDRQSLVQNPFSSGAHPDCEYMVWNEKHKQSQTAINQHSFPVQFSGLPSKLVVHAYTTLCPCSSYLCDAHRGCWLSSSHYTRRFLVQTLCWKLETTLAMCSIVVKSSFLNSAFTNLWTLLFWQSLQHRFVSPHFHLGSDSSLCGTPTVPLSFC